MPVSVRVRIIAEFQARDEIAANSVIQRIPGDLQLSIEEGRLGHAYTGVTPRSARVQVVESAVE